ncbi:MAG TPA: hypothetical protein VGN57_14855 [Pirellulaceae bacterium]|jgi:putative heme-binding domain-containing protein|nr:hypothetical protein [Pirellulaceae bacterium]
MTPRTIRSIASALFSALVGASSFAAEPPLDPSAKKLVAAEGWKVECVAGPELVAHPLMADVDDRGRLYVAASCGENLPREELERRLPNFVVRLEDVDGDGVFDKSTKFADKMTMPQGCLWYAGSLYVASSGAIWKLTDADDDGVAEKREKLVGDFGYTGNAADVHGCFLGPEGRIWWCEGRHGHEIRDAAGELISRGRAARIFNCLPDGSDVRTHCTGGMDNPVEIVFSPDGDVLGTVNLMYSQPRGDCLVHWLQDGVYPREDFAASFGEEMVRTGDLLPEVHNFGHVALSGICRLRGGAVQEHGHQRFGFPVAIAVFNTHRVVVADLKRKGPTYAMTGQSDLLVSESEDFHPTDVLQDADGSLLVIDTGGWFRIGCPQSQVAKADIKGGIWRVRDPAKRRVPDPRGTEIDWKGLSDQATIDRMEDDRPAVRDAARAEFARRLQDEAAVRTATDMAMEVLRSSGSEGFLARRSIIQAAGRPSIAAADQILGAALERSTASEPQAACRALAHSQDPDEPLPHVERLIQLLQEGKPAVQREAATTLGGAVGDQTAKATAALLALAASTVDRSIEHAALASVIRIGNREATSQALLDPDEKVRTAAALALEQMRRGISAVGDAQAIQIPAPFLPEPLSEEAVEKVTAAEEAVGGDAKRGRELFFSERGLCGKCHRVAGEGGQLGPDLSTIGAIRSRRDLAESMLYPSASFARGFEPYNLLTDDGRTFSGILLGESATELRIGVDEKRTEAVPIDSVESIRPSATSIMPSGFDQRLSAEEVADLLAYLRTLKATATNSTD